MVIWEDRITYCFVMKLVLRQLVAFLRNYDASLLAQIQGLCHNVHISKQICSSQNVE